MNLSELIFFSLYLFPVVFPRALLREVFAAVGEDHSLLQPLQDEFEARGGELHVIPESFLVDNSSGCLGCIVSK